MRRAQGASFHPFLQAVCQQPALSLLLQTNVAHKFLPQFNLCLHVGALIVDYCDRLNRWAVR